MENASFAAGTTLGRILKLFARNRFSIHIKYTLRILFLLQNGIWASAFSRLEKLRYKKRLDEYELPKDPVFIIGHWRTGSTFLLQLMNLNSELHSPSLFDITVPDSLLVSKKYYQPILKSFLAPTRPMDNVRLGIDEPQEDEFALLKITDCSPLEKLVFPLSKKYFLADYQDFEPLAENAKQWKQTLHKFYKKLIFLNNKRLVIKNPFHSMRLTTLREMYPNAKFIHIYRHPYQVIPSAIRMWDIVGKLNCVNTQWQKPSTAEAVTLLDKMLTYINKALKDLPKDQFMEVRFEEFEQDPITVLDAVYQKININFSDYDRQRTMEFISQLKGYQKNSYVLTNEEKQIIDQGLSHHLTYYGYLNENETTK